MKAIESAPATALIVAPIGKDAALAAQMLQEAQISARACRNLHEAVQALGDGTTALLLAEEALVTSELPALLEALQRQPPWSDLPVIVMTSEGSNERMSLRAVDLFGPAGNVTLLERPLHGIALVSAVKVALRARARQHEVRGLLEQRESILASISDAFSSIDRSWRYTYVNDRVAELAGLRKEEMLGRNVWEILPQAICTPFYALAQEAMEERRAVYGEIFHPSWKRWLDTRIYPTREGIVVFGADITARKEQEALAAEREVKLEESEDLLRLATEATGLGTFDYYPQTGEVRWSDRCKELFGLAASSEVTYGTYLAGVHPDDRHVVSEAVQAVSQPGSTGRFEIEYRTVGIEDGRERWVSEKGRVVLDAAGRAQRFVGTILDITDRKKAEILLQQAKGEAEAANRAKDQFLAMLSHELRTPLTPVLMTIASLRRTPDISDDLRSDLDVLQRNVELEALLIDDLLDLTRIAHGKLKLHHDAVDLHASLDHALNISRAEIDEKRLEIRREFAAISFHCWADAARMQQVFWNLVKNAVKFTPAGGWIALRTRNEGVNQIVVEISDSGIGMQPHVLPRIFDAFEQGGRTMTSEFGGLGLGLAISKRVVDLHDGLITAASAGPGQGSTFTVTFQAMETSLLTAPVVYLPQEAKPGNARILLVEDHADTARVSQRILEHAGYGVAHARDLAAARALARSQAFDLVISDLGLPDGSGLDLMRFLQAEHGLCGIALSGFGTDDDLAASAAAGFAVHLTKPVDWPQLRDAIEGLLASQAQKPAGEAILS